MSSFWIALISRLGPGVGAGGGGALRDVLAVDAAGDERGDRGVPDRPLEREDAVRAQRVARALDRRVGGDGLLGGRCRRPSRSFVTPCARRSYAGDYRSLNQRAASSRRCWRAVGGDLSDGGAPLVGPELAAQRPPGGVGDGLIGVVDERDERREIRLVGEQVHDPRRRAAGARIVGGGHARRGLTGAVVVELAARRPRSRVVGGVERVDERDQVVSSATSGSYGACWPGGAQKSSGSASAPAWRRRASWASSSP